MPALPASLPAPLPAPLQAPLPWEPPPAAPGGDAQLLDEAAAGPGDRVLIIGATSAELLCGALRHGCRAAQEATLPPLRPEPADVVVAPHVGSEEAGAALASCARRALAESAAGGRLALLLRPGTGARALARRLARRLRDYGFERIRLRARAEGDLLLVCRLQPAIR